jgi:hypothetical protein
MSGSTMRTALEEYRARRQPKAPDPSPYEIMETARARAQAMAPRDVTAGPSGTSPAAGSFASLQSIAELGGSFLPGIGDALGVRDAVRDVRDGNYGMAALNVASALPVVGVLGDAARAARKATDLPVDDAARMSRARDMGFDVDATVYHGTPDVRPIAADGFSTLRKRYAGTDPQEAYFFTDNPRMAATYADDRRALDYQNAVPAVVPAHLRTENPKIINWGGKPWRGTEQAIAAAKAEGHDGVIIRNVLDPYNTVGKKHKVKPSDVHVVFSPEQVRHVDAVFDPSKRSSPNIMAGLGAVAFGGAGYRATQDDRP